MNFEDCEFVRHVRTDHPEPARTESACGTYMHTRHEHQGVKQCNRYALSSRIFQLQTTP